MKDIKCPECGTTQHLLEIHYKNEFEHSLDIKRVSLKRTRYHITGICHKCDCNFEITYFKCR